MQGPGNEFPPQQPGPGQPWQGGPGGAAPIPPPSGAPSGYNPGGQGRINFDVIGEGWRMFQQNMGTWIVSILIYGLIVGVIAGVLAAVLGVSAANTNGNDPSAAFGMLGKQLVMQIIVGIVSMLFIGGLIRMATRQLSGRPISIGDLFSAMDVLPQIIVASILVNIITSIGYLLCVLPGLVAQGLLMFTFPLIVDRGLSATDAISQSINALKGEWLMATLFIIVISLVASVGLLACGVGVLASAPTALLASVALYRNFFGLSGR